LPEEHFSPLIACTRHMATFFADHPADILIVDDTPANLQLLTGMLKERGHKVRPVPSGRLALQAAITTPPDLILLDINMPEINGYEVCAQLKRTEATREIPVIFISALNETFDKVMAFGVGGVDYITKPFQFEEVEARVACHLNLRRLQLDLAARNEELRQTNNDLRRLQQLRDNLTHMIVHDLRSPLGGVLGTLEMIGMESSALSPANRELLLAGREAGEQMISMVNSLLDISKIEAGELKPDCKQSDLVAKAREAVSVLSGLHGMRSITVESFQEPLMLAFDPGLISRVLQNLLANAIKFTPKNGTIRIQIVRVGKGCRVSITDNGPGIAAEFHQRIFEKFGQVETGLSRVGTGLGLTFCKLVVEAHGGEIGVESTVGKGSTFWFELPGVPATANDRSGIRSQPAVDTSVRTRF
jgi:signal transduction histidine kinase